MAGGLHQLLRPPLLNVLRSVMSEPRALRRENSLLGVPCPRTCSESGVLGPESWAIAHGALASTQGISSSIQPGNVPAQGWCLTPSPASSRAAERSVCRVMQRDKSMMSTGVSGRAQLWPGWGGPSHT